MYEMEFPPYKLNQIPITEEMTDAIGIKPVEAYIDRDLLLVLETEDEVRKLNPNQDKMKKLNGLCIAVTAMGKDYDCISRVFAPVLDVAEDPVTGSTHCMIAPYWEKRLDKNKITAFQASKRTGVLYCNVTNEKVIISGKAVLFSVSEILL